MRRLSKFVANKLSDRIKLLSIELFVVLIAFVAAFITIIFVIKLIFLDKEEQFDLQVFELLKPFVSDQVTTVMKFFSFLGNHFFLVPANLLLIAYLLFRHKDKWFALRVLAVATSSLLLMFTLKFIFNRPRPLIPLLEKVPGLSFPSGHAFMSFAFFGLLIYMVYKKVSTAWLKYSLIILFFLFPFFIGVSRIYLRVHYASDVIAGFCLSLIWLVISLFIIRRIEKYNTKLPPVNKV